MTDLDVIKNTLTNNEYLSNEMKDNLFELVVVFNKQFPDIALDKLNEKLISLKIEKINSFLTNKVSKYDFNKNTIYFNEKELMKDYDVRHLLMLELLNLISISTEYSGFNYEGKFEALNIGYTEVLANYLVGNNGEELIYPNEAVMANLLSIVIGNDVLMKAYFENDYKLLLNAVKEAGIDL